MSANMFSQRSKAQDQSVTRRVSSRSPRRALVLLAALSLLVLAASASGCGASDDNEADQNSSTARAATLTDLKAAQKQAGHPVFWLGERAGQTYELSDASDSRIYVRYLPADAEIGTKDHHLTVGTYPYKNAYEAVVGMSKQPGANVVRLRDGIAVSLPAAPESTYVAFKGSDIEIELFNPGAKKPDRATIDQLTQVR